MVMVPRGVKAGSGTGPARPLLAGRWRPLRPDLAGDVADHGKLRPLLVFRQRVAFLGGGEAALGTETEPVEVGESRRLVEAPLDRVLGFQRAALGSDEAEHGDLVLGQETQGRE